MIFELNADASGSGNNRVIVKPNPLYPSISGNIEEIVLNFNTDIAGNNDTVYLTNKIGWNLGFINPLYKGTTTYVSEKAIEPNAIKIHLFSGG